MRRMLCGLALLLALAGPVPAQTTVQVPVTLTGEEQALLERGAAPGTPILTILSTLFMQQLQDVLARRLGEEQTERARVFRQLTPQQQEELIAPFRTMEN